MRLPDKVYDWLKWIAVILFPALGTLYGTLGVTWNWPYVQQIQTTLDAVGLFIGTIIGLSTIAYNKAKAEHFTDNE